MPRPVCITYDSTCDLTPQLLERLTETTPRRSCTPITAGTALCPKQQRSVQKRSRHFSPRF